MRIIKRMLCIIFPLFATGTSAQSNVSGVWVPDMGNGKYRNPVIHADYSDPDVCRVGDDYYMTASSFNCIPGLPVLHSRDLVNWTLIGHALRKLEPSDVYDRVQHGKGVWAPCIKYHKGEFYIFWGDPDYGIFMVKSMFPDKGWSDPRLVMAGKGMIDPCPLWDDDGRAYLAFAWAASRSGVNSVIITVEMNPEGTDVISEPVMVFDGNYNINHTVEGPKLYKRDGYYYIFAPAGSVSRGWQLVMRSGNIYGPYEWRKVMEQGKTDINGPHQGAWVETPDGGSWFVHFQDKGAYGRVIHLNPMEWKDGWPVIGIDKDGDGCGAPYYTYSKPAVGAAPHRATPQENDDFDSPHLGLQWQWQANYNPLFGYPSSNGYFRLNAYNLPSGEANLYNTPNMLLQKLPAERFSVVTKMRFAPKQEGDRAGLIIMGLDYGYIGVICRDDKLVIGSSVCIDAENGASEIFTEMAEIPLRKEFYGSNITRMYSDIYFRIDVAEGGICSFLYSLDGKKYVKSKTQFTAREGKWIGAKTGFFCITDSPREKCWADIDWFRIER